MSGPPKHMPHGAPRARAFTHMAASYPAPARWRHGIRQHVFRGRSGISPGLNGGGHSPGRMARFLSGSARRFPGARFRSFSACSSPDSPPGGTFSSRLRGMLARKPRWPACCGKFAACRFARGANVVQYYIMRHEGQKSPRQGSRKSPQGGIRPRATGSGRAVRLPRQSEKGDG